MGPGPPAADEDEDIVRIVNHRDHALIVFVVHPLGPVRFSGTAVAAPLFHEAQGEARLLEEDALNIRPQEAPAA